MFRQRSCIFTQKDEEDYEKVIHDSEPRDNIRIIKWNKTTSNLKTIPYVQEM